MRTPLLALTLLAALAACTPAPPDARTSGQARYKGRPLAEWWALRRDPDDATAREAVTAMRMLGPAAVPFLAEKAAGRDLADVIGASAALERMCPSALPALRAAGHAYPSAAVDGAIRRVQAEAAARTRAGECTADGDPAPPDTGRRAGGPAAAATSPGSG